MRLSLPLDSRYTQWRDSLSPRRVNSTEGSALRCFWRLLIAFFFSSRRRHTRYIGDWSSDVCSSDLQFLGKPPAVSVETYWHQDEAYWGRNLDDKGITCWMPLHDVDERNGCMHFVDGGHHDGVLAHRQPENVQSDLLFCEPDVSRTVACPIRLGDVTFHHSKTPHMTTANTSDQWRLAVTQHMQAPDSGGEGDHYPWKVYVNQMTGQRVKPPSR